MRDSRKRFNNWLKQEKRNPLPVVRNSMFEAWQAGIATGKVVAYMTHQGSAVSPDDFAGGEEEMHHSAKMEGWTPLIAGITVKGEGDE